MRISFRCDLESGTSQILLRVFGKADGSTKTSHSALDGQCEEESIRRCRGTPRRRFPPLLFQPATLKSIPCGHDAAGFVFALVTPRSAREGRELRDRLRPSLHFACAAPVGSLHNCHERGGLSRSPVPTTDRAARGPRQRDAGRSSASHAGASVLGRRGDGSEPMQLRRF